MWLDLARREGRWESRARTTVLPSTGLMRWRALCAWGACATTLAATPLGCEAFAPLDGLSGGKTKPTSTDASAPGEGGEPDTGAAVDAFAPDAGDGASAPGTDARDDEASKPPVDAGEAGDGGAPPATIAFVQIATATPAGSVSSVSAKFTGAQKAGDLNIVAIGWNDTTVSVSTVTDTRGNVYQLAVGPTRISPDLTQYIYYAKDIAAAGAASNTVTVDFAHPANVVDLRAVEYSGLDATAPFDSAAAASGNGAGPALTGKVTTTAASSLLFAAGMTTDTYSAAGPGYTSRVVTSLGDLVEDRIVSSPGSYDAQASLGASSYWILQIAAFH
jgi:hypothetical protein